MREPGELLVVHPPPVEGLELALLRARNPPSSSRRALVLAATFMFGVGAGALGVSRLTSPLTAPPVAVQPEGVVLVFTAPGARHVGVAGTWNHWDPQATQMQEVQRGVFRAIVPLAEGRYEYQFVVDGQQWVPDPAALVYHDDGFGTHNSVLEI